MKFSSARLVTGSPSTNRDHWPLRGLDRRVQEDTRVEDTQGGDLKRGWKEVRGGGERVWRGKESVGVRVKFS